MKVLHVIPSVASVRGGPSQAIYEMTTSLRDKQGVEVEIATTNDNGENLLDVPLDGCHLFNNVPTYFFSRFSPPIESIREFAFSSSLTAWLWQNICAYDLVHIHAIFSYPSTIAMTIARARKVPYIVRPLGQLCEWSLTQSYKKKQAYLRLIERANLEGCQMLHLTSQQEQQEVEKLDLKTSSFILPHGLEFCALKSDSKKQLRNRLNIPEDEPIVLFLSRIHEKKGLDYLIPALASIASERFTFVLAGSGDPAYEAEVQNLLETHNLKERTISTGFVEGEFKSLLLQGADIFALTSYSENFGVAVLEALAAGTPALVTPGVALCSEIDEHNLGYVVPQTASDIANALKLYLNLPCEKQNTIGARAIQLIREKYSWEKVSEELSNIYASAHQAVSIS